jgi:microcystin-dependent protein
MANYTNERARYGGCTGQILVHSSPSLGTTNSPTSAQFKAQIPAGYLRCDGSILNVRDYFNLAQILGVGAETRFARNGANIRDPDLNINDLGQFQLPDLGSKVIIGGRGTGLYNNDFVDKGVESNVVTNRVGPQIEVTSNFGNTITANYIGNMQLAASGTVNMLGNPVYDMVRETSETTLNIDNFQGHAHNTTTTTYLNHSDNHATAFFGGKDYAKKLANSGAGHTIDFARDWEVVSSHKHILTTPNTYNSNFTYSHPVQEIDLSRVAATVDVDVSDQEKLDELVTPFILVEYIIKF